jgi:predicted protein tyrosine phosphatase
MKHKGLKIYHLAQSYAEKWVPNPDRDIMISISQPENREDGLFIPRLNESWKHIYCEDFHDIDVEEKGFVVFNEDMANNMIDFLEKYRIGISNNEYDYLVIHCWAGISRSAAVAKFADEFYGINEFPEKYTLYNKLVYTTLRNIWEKRRYDLFKKELGKGDDKK